MNILVLAGGLSTERDVSLSTGGMVCCALREIDHRALLADVFLGLDTGGAADLVSLFTGNETPTQIAAIPRETPDLAAVRAKRADGGFSFFGPNVLALCQAADLVFIALHGLCGEDGRLQAALELLGVPFTGTDSLGSALAMDKDLTKKLLGCADIPTASWRCLGPGCDPVSAAAEIGLPCVIKPVSGGSSVGVSIAHTREELKEGIRELLAAGDRLMLEEYIGGREFSVGILDGEALPVIEIIPHQGFYDYRNKYQQGLTDELCPAPLREDQRAEVQRLALKVHETLRLGSYSRVDFILDRASDRFICLEANTLPGMTPSSLLPQEAKAAGLSYNELCWRIVAAAGRPVW